MRLILLGLLSVLTIGCGIEKGDEFIDPETGKAVTVYSVDEYQVLKSTQELSKSSKQDGSSARPNIVIEEDNITSYADSSNLILAGWYSQNNEKYFLHLKIYERKLLIEN